MSVLSNDLTYNIFEVFLRIWVISVISLFDAILQHKQQNVGKNFTT